ncbi:MAG TPA: hypothetical protein VJ698_19490 [Noviherbaspirillum sp.]|uniref:hypothetical protein n=1 Tax=Noviherbaspirillum sp. TaxID=1926288 RepID=UPI002B4914DF|nr:hypothetical protein [Noviherbaspirillum sp.]HJV87662.1 hypothetical protein [Noviherbaspirillum sp.]
MGWLQQSREKSLFGQLLLKHDLVSEEQLARAIEQQRRTGQRLGDILAEWNLVTQRHVQEVLRKQRNLRLAATIAAMLMGPLRAYATDPLPAQVTVSAQAPDLHARDEAPHGLRAMTEEDLDRVSAQGLTDDLLNRATKRQNGDSGLRVLGDVATMFNPLLGFLEADTTIKDVVYDPANAAVSVSKDGAIVLRLPSTIGEISFDNIRIRGTSGASFGSIHIHDIDLTGTTVVLRSLPR